MGRISLGANPGFSALDISCGLHVTVSRLSPEPHLISLASSAWLHFPESAWLHFPEYNVTMSVNRDVSASKSFENTTFNTTGYSYGECLAPGANENATMYLDGKGELERFADGDLVSLEVFGDDAEDNDAKVDPPPMYMVKGCKKKKVKSG